MSYIDIRFKEDVRKVFNEGENLHFEIPSGTCLNIVGKNGCGKSTFVNIIRAHKCDNAGAQDKSMNYSEINLLKHSVEFNTDFEKIYIVSSEFDDPLGMNNTYDACIFIEMGGFYTSRLSHGQRTQYVTVDFIQKNRDNWDENTLVIFDEVDSGCDVFNQGCLGKLMNNIAKKQNCSVINISHSAILLLANDTCYDMKNRMLVDTKDWIEKETGMKF